MRFGRFVLLAVLFALIVAAVVAGCSGGGGETPATQAPATALADPPVPPIPPDAAAEAGGFLQLPAPEGVGSRAGANLVLVDSLADAPPGAVPVSGAEFRLINRQSREVAVQGTTSADGSLLIQNISFSHGLIEIRLDPLSTVPDLEIVVTLVLGKQVRAGAEPAISRDQAIQAVLGLAPAGAMVVCTQNPLPQGTLVYPIFGNERGEGPFLSQAHQIGANGEWFLLSDENVFDQFVHELEYFFVDAVTGEVERQQAFWWPAVNGAPFWPYQGDLFRPIDVNPLELLRGDYPDGTFVQVSADVVRLLGDDELLVDREIPVEEFLPGLLEPLVPEDNVEVVPVPEDHFALTWVGTPEDWFVLDSVRLAVWARAMGFPNENIIIVTYSDNPLVINPEDLGVGKLVQID